MSKIYKYKPWEKQGIPKGEYFECAHRGARIENGKLKEKNEQLREALDGILKNVSCDWYVQQFYRPETASMHSTGVAAKIHNKETLERIVNCFKKAKDVLNQNVEE